MRVLTIAVIALLQLGGCSGDGGSEEISTAEKFIDAFYSFDRSRLEPLLAHADETVKKEITYYQGWAEGGHYAIVNRMPCTKDGTGKVKCPITVKDDHMAALGIPFDVTDTFHLAFKDGKITSVETSSNDLDVYVAARDWVNRMRPDLVREPCKGFFEGGPTPQQCAEAMAQGYADFAASDDFPADPMTWRSPKRESN
jgi:hypothetical protein